MILLVPVLVLCVAFPVSSLLEGDLCTDEKDNSPGVCRLLNSCLPIEEELQAGITRGVQICSWYKNHPVVCCPTNTPRTTTTTTIQPTTQKLENVHRGSIAKRKCAEYSRYVFDVRYSFGVPLNVSQCVVRSVKLIRGGTRADPKEFPHMAAIGFHLRDDTVIWPCGGTLISETFVLTAAHCTHSEGRAASRVRVGDLNLDRQDDGAQPIERRIIEHIRHPEYRPPSQYHDIALLKLESRVPFNAWIRPACLHTESSTATENAIATGWGRVEWMEAAGSSDLLKVTMRLVDDATCKTSYSSGAPTYKLPNGVKEEWMICAGEPDKDTCQGDSGGPLVIFSKPQYYCMYDVIGVTSLGSNCGSGFPGVYTRIYHYINWIESVVWGQG